MKIIKINEEITQRGMNNLYYQIEVYNVNEDGSLSYCNLSDFSILPYQRNNITNVLHETSIFKYLKKCADEEIKFADEELKKYCKKMNDTIKAIELIENVDF